MTEAHLVAKKLALIETYLRELRSEGRPELITKDLRELRFTEHTLQRPAGSGQELQESIEQPARWRAHSGRLRGERLAAGLRRRRGGAGPRELCSRRA